MWSSSDRAQFESRGIPPAEIDRQIGLLTAPPPPIRLDRPCAAGDGILRIQEPDVARLVECYEQAAAGGRLMKFVPASGAASRMFKSLLAMLGDPVLDDPAALRARAADGDGDAAAVARLIDDRGRFPFLDAWNGVVNGGLEAAVGAGRYGAVLAALLDPGRLGLAARPKGLIPFHRYPHEVRTAFEEHLVEGATYARGGDRRVQLHMTISPEHRPGFDALWAAVRDRYEKRFRVRFELGFSYQEPFTDTVAVDGAGDPFRLEDGSLLFRPGGHGALLTNLDRLGGDVIFIKNIDNVVPDPSKPPTVQWKKLIAGLLVEIQEDCFAVLRDLDRGDDGAVERGLRIAADRFGSPRAAALLASGNREDSRTFVVDRLNRPLRVCGVVRNEGEPGGGPFWVRADGDETSPQIVESAEVDLTDAGQAAIWNGSTHFNPVDLACAVRDHRGRPFALGDFVDPRTVFIATKSHEGRELHALEHPGLWNGAMARWNTVFVEVPSETFAPVKTVFDLLRDKHQTGMPA